MIPFHWKEYRMYDDNSSTITQYRSVLQYIFDYWFWFKEMMIVPFFELMNDVMTNCLLHLNNFFYYDDNDKISQISKLLSTVNRQLSINYRISSLPQILTIYPASDKI